jgi:DNA-binding Xre family transcriptional regulator
MSGNYGSASGESPKLTGAASPHEETAAAPAKLIVLRIRRREQVKAGILKEYFRAAERGKISFLKYYRLAKGMDQQELAARAKMTQSAVARAEKPGQLQNMKGFSLKKLAAAVGVRVDDLLQ